MESRTEACLSIVGDFVGQVSWVEYQVHQSENNICVMCEIKYIVVQSKNNLIIRQTTKLLLGTIIMIMLPDGAFEPTNLLASTGSYRV